MSLLDALNEDLKKFLKEGDVEKANALRFLLSQIHNREIEKRGSGVKVLGDDDIIEVLQKEAKKRKEAIELFRKGNRDDLIKKEENELSLITSYLPQPATHEEIEAIVDKLQKEGFSDFNSLIRETMKLLKGRVDGKTVSEIIKKRLK